MTNRTIVAFCLPLLLIAAAGTAEAGKMKKWKKPDAKKLVKACDGGDLAACAEAGYIYWNGYYGVAYDTAKAVENYTVDFRG